MINNERILVVFVFCFALIAGLLAPTFPDEITNIFLTAKVAFNNPIRDWLIPSCLEAPIYPDFLYLMISSLNKKLLSFVDAPIKFRLISLFTIITFCIWVRLIKSRLSDLQELLIPAALILWPIIFFNILIFNRPEKIIVFFCIFSIWFIFVNAKQLNNRIVVLSAYILLFEIAILNHPKAFYLLPIFGLVCFSNWTKATDKVKKFLVIMLFLLSLIFAKSILDIHLQTWPCYGVDYINNINKGYAINALDLFIRPYDFFNNILAFNTADKTSIAIHELFLKKDYGISYLPHLDLWKFNFLNYFYIATLIYVLTINLMASLKIFREQNIYTLFFFTYVLSACVFYLFSGTKACYDVSMFVFQMALIYPFRKSI